MEQDGARYADGQLADFGQAEQEISLALESDVLADLSHQGLIKVSGEGAETFLAGQLTSDVRRVSEGLSQLGAWCTAAGRVLALFHILRRDDAYYLLLPAESLEATLRRLRQYVLRSPVQLADASGELVRIGLSGPRAADGLASRLGPVALDENQSLRVSDYTIVRLAGVHSRYLIIAPPGAALILWRSLRAYTTAVGFHAWMLLDILAGHPAVVPAISELFLPQMLNLHALDGLSFSKGCYPGQEVIARLKYRGQLKRRMYLASANTHHRPQPGQALFRHGGEGQSIGTIVTGELHPEGGAVFLAVIDSDAATAELRLHLPDGPAVKLQALPYSVPEA